MGAYPSRRTLRRVELGAMLLFLAVAADVWFGGLGTRLDAWLGDWVLAEVDGASRLRFDDWVSAPGHTSVAFAVLLVGAAMCLGLGRWFNAALLIGAGTLSILIVEALKVLYGRERPLEGLDPDAFPSGHVAKAVVVWGLAFAMVLDALLHRKPGTMPGMRLPAGAWRSLLGLWAVLVTTTVAGRLFAGEHWLTDTVAAVALGVAFVCETLVQHDRLADAAEPDRPLLRRPPSYCATVRLCSRMNCSR